MTRPAAIITGAARRVGAIIAKTLHTQGYNIIIHYRHSQVEARQLCQELNTTQANSAISLQADLSDTSSLEMLISNGAAQWGRLDLLVNNASSFYPTPVTESTEQQWDDLINSNVKGAYFLSSFATPHLAEQKGSIVNIIDIYGENPLRGYPIYCMAKAGLRMMTKSLAKELGPDIRVNAIAPGSTLWPESVNALDDARKQKLIEKTALKCKADPQDIANAVVFFAGSKTITGQILNVDAGRAL